MTIDKISNVINKSENNSDIISNQDDIGENGVSKNDTLSNSSNDENIVGVEVSSDEGVVSVNEPARGYGESCSGYRGQRANFPRFECGVKAPHVFKEDVSSFRVYLGDN